jgi:hypothetical protein
VEKLNTNGNCDGTKRDSPNVMSDIVQDWDHGPLQPSYLECPSHFLQQGRRKYPEVPSRPPGMRFNPELVRFAVALLIGSVRSRTTYLAPRDAGRLLVHEMIDGGEVQLGHLHESFALEI